MAQFLLREKLPSDKFLDYLGKFTNYSDATYEKIEYIVMPLIGALFVLLLVSPQTILAQAVSGLTWSTTVAAIYNKATKKNE